MSRPESAFGPVWRSAFDQANITRPRTLTGILGSEIHTLSFAQQFEDCAAYRTAVKEVFDAALIADEAEALVDEESCDGPARHTRSPPFDTRVNPRDDSAGIGSLRNDDCVL